MIQGLPDQLITLTDLNGKEYKFDLKNNLLSVSLLQNGIYFLQTEQGTGKFKVLILK